MTGELSMYRFNARINNQNIIRYVRGWNQLDAMKRLSTQLRLEGHTLYTLTPLDQKAIQ